MKRSRRGLSKKGLKGLVRVRNNAGIRVWKYAGQEYETLRQVTWNTRQNQA